MAKVHRPLGYRIDASAVLEDPRVRLTVDDAVNHLLRSRNRYDLIVSDGKQDAFFSGNATLLSSEYYRFARSRMTDRGLFVQWIPMAMLASDFQTNLRTLCDAFDHVELFYFPAKSIFMIASQAPVFGREQLSADSAAAAGTFADLRVYGMESVEALLARWVCGKTQLQDVLGDGPISTWDKLILDYAPFKTAANIRARSKLDNLALLLRAAEVPRAKGLGSFIDHGSPVATSTKLVRLAYVEYFSHGPAAALPLLSHAIQTNPDDQAAAQIFRWMQRQFLNQDGLE